MKRFFLFFLFPTLACADGINGLIIGNMAQQNMTIDGSEKLSDSYLSWGLGASYSSSLWGMLGWEAGINYVNREIGSDSTTLKMTNLQIPIGLRFSLYSISISAGVYQWQGQGDIVSSEDGKDSYKHFGYKDAGNGTYLGIGYHWGPSYIELRKISGTTNDSDEDDVKIQQNDTQIILGYSFSMGEDFNAEEATFDE